MAESQHKARKKRAWWKRALRGLLFMILGVTLLLGLLMAALRVLYPPHKLKMMINTAVEQNLARSLTLGDVWIHPLRGLILEEVRLSPYPDSTAGYDLFPIRQLYVRKIALHYSLRDLLDRQVHITAVDFIEPELEFYIDLLDTSAIDFAALLSTDLPVSFDLKALRFQNSSIRVLAADTLVKQELFIGDLSCYLDDVHLPGGGFAANDSSLSLILRVESRNTPLHIAQRNLQDGSGMHTEAVMNFSTWLKVASFRDIALRLRLDLDRVHTTLDNPDSVQSIHFPAAIRLETAMRGDGRAGRIDIDSLALAFDGETWLRLRIGIDSLLAQPHLHLAVERGFLPLADLLHALRHIAPDAVPVDGQWLDRRAALRFDGTTLAGTLDGEMQYKVNLALTHAGAVLNRDSIRIEALSANVHAQGLLDAMQVRDVKATIEAGYDSITLKQPDGSALNFGGGRLNVGAILNDRFLPQRLDFSLRLHNLLGAEVTADGRFSGGSSLQQLQGTAALYLDHIDFSRLTGAAIQGDAAAQWTLRLNSLRHIDARLQLNTSELTLLQEEEPLLLPGLAFSLALLARTDTSFAVIDIDSLSCALNRLFTAQARARLVNSAQPQLHFALSELRLDHAAIWEYIPEVLREPWLEAEISGSTLLAAHGDVLLQEQGLTYQLRANLSTRQTAFRAPAQFLTLEGIDLNLALHATSAEGVRLETGLNLESLQQDQNEIIVFTGNELAFNLISRDLQSLRLEQGRLSLPDLNTRGDFTLTLDDLYGNPSIRAQVSLQQHIPDTLRLPQGIRLHGDSDIRCRVEADTATAHIRADILTRGLSLFMPGSLVIRDVETNLHLVQEIDLLNKKLLGSTAEKIATPSTAFMDYMVYRDYYQNLLPDLSSIRIGCVEVMDYKIEDIRLELQVGEGRLEVPALMARIYGGNMGARLAVDFAGGDLTRAGFTVNAHFANINSNLLLPKRARDANQGIINANMDLRGRGMDITREMSLEGQLYITEIGPRVADNLLRSLDPQGTDSSIRTTRLLINRGFKPKLMTFLLRHGYLYPEIVFDQPWYFPVRLSGGKVELARIPLEFFLKNSMQSAAAR